MAEEHDEHGGGESHGGGGGHGGGGHGPGGGHHEEGEAGAPEWLISFADNVALLMGFFVILLAMNMKKESAGGIGGEAEMGGTPDAAMVEFVMEMREAFNNPLDMNSTDPREQEIIQLAKTIGRGESNQPESHGAAKESQARRPTKFSNLGGTVTFDDHTAELSPRGEQRVAEIGRRIKGLRFIIEVHGHASPSEVQRNDDQAMLLSYQRARAVRNSLIREGVRPSQIVMKQAGAYQRVIARTYDRDQDRSNQRVEIIVTQTEAPDLMPARPAGPVSGGGSGDDQAAGHDEGDAHDAPAEKASSKGGH